MRTLVAAPTAARARYAAKALGVPQRAAWSAEGSGLRGIGDGHEIVAVDLPEWSQDAASMLELCRLAGAIVRTP